MKQDPITWQFGDDEITLEPFQAANNPQQPGRPARKRSRRTWLLVFLVALVVSWTTGFYLGRVQQTSAALQAEIQGRLDVESWAWRQGDWNLFRSLLPTPTPSWRLKTLQTSFEAQAPDNRHMKLTHYVVSQDGGQITAVVQVSAGDQQYEIERAYRFIGGRWRLVWLEEFDGGTAHP